MAVRLVQGAVTDLQRNESSVSFRIRKHVFRASPHPDLFLLENGTFVQLLVDVDLGPQPVPVHALKCEGYPPVYLGPRIGWSSALAAVAVALAAVASHHEWFLTLPAMLGIAHGYFLMRRARIFESFTTELAELRNAPLG
jgi:hypothetical protein